jgi:hypothetical protein
VDVQWDSNGRSNSYRMGAEGKFDLSVIDVIVFRLDTKCQVEGGAEGLPLMDDDDDADGLEEVPSVCMWLGGVVELIRLLVNCRIAFSSTD